MPAFTSKDIADYYNQTLTHYRMWWRMDQSKAIHYGIWDHDTKTFGEALQQTNLKMAELAGIKKGARVMDAGCGVGGAAFYLATNYNCTVDGISLSERQIELAKASASELQLEKSTRFMVADYNKTPFANNSFDLIWACESLCYASNTDLFLSEANRLLKKGGKIVLSDYFLTQKGIADEQSLMKKWGNTWAISHFNELHAFSKSLERNGFQIIENKDFSQQVYKSAKRMYHAYLIGSLPAVLYNLTHNSSRFAKTQYLSGKYQFLALKQKLWEYRLVVAEKIR